MKKIFDKECEVSLSLLKGLKGLLYLSIPFPLQVKDKELELERVRGDHEQRLRDVENELNQKLKDLEEEANNQEEMNKKELEQAVNKDRFNELEDAIHQKTLGKIYIIFLI
jgi:predicted nuclease with TOPRIM domain